MKTKTSRVLRKSIASALVLLMVTAPMSPVADVFNIGAGTIVNAVDYFEQAELTTAPDGVVVYSDRDGTAAELSANNKPILRSGYYIVSAKVLSFKSAEATVATYALGAPANPYPDYYCYKIDEMYSATVTAEHKHYYEVDTQSIPSKMQVWCTGETTGKKVAAELTIDRDVYEYGDKIAITHEGKQVDEYDILPTDFIFDDITFRDVTNEKNLDDMPAKFGNYKASVGVNFIKKSDASYYISKEFSIQKKNIANLLKASDAQAEKNDHMEFSLDPADGPDYDPDARTVTYNNVEYQPSIKLVNYVYSNGEYTEEELTENVDYTATLTPAKNAGEYEVTVTATENSENYKGSGTFKWNINTREFTVLSAVDSREEADKIYDGQPVENTGFTVSGFENGNPGITSATDLTLTYKYYALKEDVTDTSLTNLAREDFQEVALESNPVDAGIYYVEIEVIDKEITETQSHNYKAKKVGTAFEIKKRAAVVDPGSTNDIVYGEFVDTDNLDFSFAEGSVVAGDEVSSDEVGLKVIKSADGENKVYVSDFDLLNAGTYDYELDSEECTNGNYYFELSEGAVLTVAKRALSKATFTVDYVDSEDNKIDGPHVYNGKEQKVRVTAEDKLALAGFDEYEGMLFTDSIIAGTDWTASNDKATNADTYTVTVTASENGNYTGTVELTDQAWTIEPKSITELEENDTITVDITGGPFVYNASDYDITNNIVVKDSEIVDAETGELVPLVKGTDYEIVSEATETYDDAQALVQKNAGTYKFYVVGKGNYKDSRSKEWTIEKAEATVKISGRKTFVYDGQTAESRFKAKIVDTDEVLAIDSFKWAVADQTVEGGYREIENAPKDAGKYAVKAVTKEGTNYKPSEPENWYNFEITKRKVEIYPDEGQNSEYGEQIKDITYQVETAETDSATGLVEGDEEVDFSELLTIDTSSLDDPGQTPVPAGYYPIIVKENAETKNYIPSCDGSVEYQVTKVKLKSNMFKLVLKKVSNQTDPVEQEGTSVEFSEDKYTVEVRPTVDAPTEDIMDHVKITGTTTAYLPKEGGYKVTVTAKDDSEYYEDFVEYTWDITAKEIRAMVSVEDQKQESGQTESEYYYNGRTPVVEINPVNNDQEQTPIPEFTELTCNYWRYDGIDPETEEEVWTALEDAAPVDAGTYKVQVQAKAKGYNITLVNDGIAEFEILPRRIVVTVDTKDLKAYFNPNGYSISWTEQENAYDDFGAGYIAADKEKGAKVDGVLTPDFAGEDNNVGKYAIDTTGLKVVINGETTDNYFVEVFESENGDYSPELGDFEIVAAPIKDNWIVFVDENGVPMVDEDGNPISVYDKYDIGESKAYIAVYYNGVIDENNLLVKDEDYEFVGDTIEGDESNTIQVSGKGKYTDFAEATWTVAYNPEAKEAAVALIKENVTVEIIDVSAGLKNGQKKITVKVQSSASEGYKITKTGVYYSVDDGENWIEMSRAGVNTYTANIQTDGTIKVKAFAEANDSKYKTIVETDPAVEYNYDEIVRYTITLNGGTFVSEYPENGFTGIEVKNNKPIIRVTANEAEEGEKFYCWQKNGIVVSYNATYAFYMSEKNEEVTAVFVGEDEEVETFAITYIENVTPNKETGKVTFVAIATVPEDFKMVKMGVVATDDPDIGVDISVDSVTANADCKVFVKELAGVTENTKTAKYSWTKSQVVEGHEWFVRSYVIYIENEEEKILYSDAITADLNGIIKI